MDRLNESRCARIIAKCLPEFCNADREDGVTHNRVWPHGLQQ
jgi:hypothetical protein